MDTLPPSITEEITYIFATETSLEYEDQPDLAGLFLYSAFSDTWTRWIPYPEVSHWFGALRGGSHCVVDIDRNILYCYAGENGMACLNLITRGWNYEWIDFHLYGRVSCMLIVDSKLYLFRQTETCIVWNPLKQKTRKVNHGIMVYGSNGIIVVEKAVYVPSEHSICIISIDGDRIQFTSWSLDKSRDRFVVKAACDHGLRRDGLLDMFTGTCKYATLTEDERFIILCIVKTRKNEPNVLVVDRKNEYKLTECKISKATFVHIKPAREVFSCGGKYELTIW